MESFNSNNQIIIKAKINSVFHNTLIQWDNFVAVTIQFWLDIMQKKSILNYA